VIRVLNIITDMSIGGAGKVLVNFLEATDRGRFDHTIIVPEGSELSPVLGSLGIRVVEMAGIGGRSFSPFTIGKFRREFKQLKPDIIHTHASLSARIAAKMWSGKCAVVNTRHCAYPQSKLKTTFPVKQLLGFVNNYLSDTIIAISPASRDNLVETGADPRKIVTMFNGVEPVRRLTIEEKDAVRASLGIRPEHFVCSIIARFVPEKGHLYVLEAASMLADLPIRFIIAGYGPYENEVRAAAESLKLDNCIFTGFISDIATIENITDLQINASYGTETSSLSLLEGMSLSTPAVASDYGGNPYLITDGENGLIVPQHDGAAVAEAVRRLYGERDTLARMGNSALRIYNERFTAVAMAAAIEKVYNSLCPGLLSGAPGKG